MTCAKCAGACENLSHMRYTERAQCILLSNLCVAVPHFFSSSICYVVSFSIYQVLYLLHMNNDYASDFAILFACVPVPVSDQQ